MAKIPGIGVLSGIGLLGKCFYDEVKMQGTLNAIGQRDPRQTIIMETLDEFYSWKDIQDLKETWREDLQKAGENLGLRDEPMVFRSVVSKWCHKFNVPYNSYGLIHHPKRRGFDEKYADKKDEDLYRLINSKLDIYETETRKAKEAYDALPFYKKSWFQQVSYYLSIWGLIGLGLLVLTLIFKL